MAKRLSSTTKAKLAAALNRKMIEEADAVAAAVVIARASARAATISPVLPQDHPDAALGELCATLAGAQWVLEVLERGGEEDHDAGLSDAALAQWEVAALKVADVRARTAAGLALKAAHVAPTMKLDAKIGLGSALRDALAQSLAADAMSLPASAPLSTDKAPPPFARCAITTDRVDTRLLHSLSIGQTVIYQTTGRSGRSPERRGKVVSFRATVRGTFVTVEARDGQQVSVRPALIRAV